MDQNRTELEKKIVAAGSPEEIERILNDAGEKITAEEAQQLFEKVKSRAADKDYCCPICGAVATPVHRTFSDACQPNSVIFFTFRGKRKPVIGSSENR